MQKAAYFHVLTSILKKKGYADIPPSEEQLLANCDLLEKCIDDVLIDEFCRFGLQKNGEPNAYGLKIEDVIDYYNKKRE